ncbi:MAG: NAD-dependent epimerase/dehydratase family protein [Chloroflexota bacterium]
MNVLIIGGTGFLGYHATKEFIQRGHSVTVLARSPVTIPNLFPPTVQVKLADLNQLSDEAVQELVAGHQAVVYAAGANANRAVPKPAYDYFYTENVKYTARFFKLARMAGAKRGVLLGSYFCYFDRLWPEMRLAEHHPYIRSRKEQEQESLNAALPDLELMILEIPYVFGAMPGRIPSWSPLIKYVNSPFPLFFTHGGTNMIAAKHVAEAIAGAIEQGTSGERYVIGEENVTWSDLLKRLGEMMGKHKQVITIPTPLVKAILRAVEFRTASRNLEGGLHPGEYAKFQTTNTFFDPAPSRLALNYGQGGLNQAFQDTIRACIGHV